MHKAALRFQLYALSFISYSVFRLLTGFDNATFRHCNVISAKAMIVIKTPDIRYILIG